MAKININEVFKHYIMAARWSSTTDDGTDGGIVRNLDDPEFDDLHFDKETTKFLLEEVKNFINDNKELISESRLTSEEIGHSFWLSRNGHGSGFFDYNTVDSDIYAMLDDISEEFGNIDLYVGDDYKIYSMQTTPYKQEPYPQGKRKEIIDNLEPVIYEYFELIDDDTVVNFQPINLQGEPKAEKVEITKAGNFYLIKHLKDIKETADIKMKDNIANIQPDLANNKNPISVHSEAVQDFMRKYKNQKKHTNKIKM